MKKIICCILAGILLSFAGGMNLILAQPKDERPQQGSQSQATPEKCKPPHDKGPECKTQKKGKQQPPPPHKQDKPKEKPPKDKQPPPDTNNDVKPPQGQPPQN